MSEDLIVFFVGFVVCIAILSGGIFIGIEIERNHWLSADATIQTANTKAATKGNQDLAATDKQIEALRDKPIPPVRYEKDADCQLPSAAIISLRRP